MNIAEIIKNDVANGPGIRLSIFVSGCTHNCEGCFNKEAQDFQYGRPYDENIQNEILKELSKSQYSGVSLLGGEPMHPDNQKTVLSIIQTIKNKQPDKTIWLYSGYLYEDLKKQPTANQILSNIDVLVDGPFILSQKKLGLAYRGSSNQRLIDMKATNAKNEVILWQTNITL